MPAVRVIVLRAAGINCDEEVMHCWRLAGAEPRLVHVSALAREPQLLESCHIVTIPGGFSYGDDIAAGVILAQRIVQELAEPLRRLVDRGGGILGICNGFQVLVKAGLLPGEEIGRDRVTLTYNESARFEARWTRMVVCTDRCPFLPVTAAGAQPHVIELPVEHAEGRVITADPSTLDRLQREGLVALRYIGPDGGDAAYPANPSGSAAGIAGLCDRTGRIFGLMPHPDRHFLPTHHPLWTRRPLPEVPDGLMIFRNAVAHWTEPGS